VNGRIQAARSYAGFEVESPLPWRPNGYGEQPLYNCKVSFFQDGRERDTREGRFAFREVKTYEEPLEPNDLTWGIEVNGRKILVRGPNWVPSRLFPICKKSKITVESLAEQSKPISTCCACGAAAFTK